MATFRVKVELRTDGGMVCATPTEERSVLVACHTAADARGLAINEAYRLAEERGEVISHVRPVLVTRVKDRPIPGRQYRLTGGGEDASILRGDSWEASEVRTYPIARKV